nr:hypothetical protein [Microbacterium hydrocarbonoxydans]
MFVVGVITAVAGIVLFHTALGYTIKANPTARLPFGRRPPISPRGTVEMRALAAGLIVLGAVLVGTSGWQWTAMVVAAGPIAALSVIALHNRRARLRAGAEERR